ncbi:MAG: DUF523 and DUF1722 domain-containing protein [Sulfolobales archaeon]|nr:DUF523 and DUF1722 domain-containing protein [Sulfolobales archaeon]
MSECLGVRAVRYDGNVIYDRVVEAVKKFVDVVPVCPEVGMGLGVPRDPLILVKKNSSTKLILTKTGEDFTERLLSFADSFLSSANSVDGVLLKSASPSCGVRDAKVYGKGGGVVARSDGLFAAVVRSRYPHLPIESEKRLLNYEIRRDFLTRVFAIAHVREVTSGARDFRELVELHRRYKYVLMLYNPSKLKTLGRMAAGAGEENMREVSETYMKTFLEALFKPPKRGSYANVLTHIYSHIKKELTEEERRYVLDLVERYRRGLVDLKTLLIYFKGFIYRLGSKYLAEQKFMNPYPEELDNVVV